MSEDDGGGLMYLSARARGVLRLLAWGDSLYRFRTEFRLESTHENVGRVHVGMLLNAGLLQIGSLHGAETFWLSPKGVQEASA